MWDHYLKDHHWYNQDAVFAFFINIFLGVIIGVLVCPMAILEGINIFQDVVKGDTKEGHNK